MGSDRFHAVGDVVVRNLTSRRIAIARVVEGASALILPPFGERVLPGDELAGYDHGPWVAQGLLLVDAPAAMAPARVRRSLHAKGSGYSFLLTLAFLLIGWMSGEATWLYAAGVAATATAVLAWYARWHVDAWRAMTRSALIFSVVLITFGATLGAVTAVTPFEGTTWAQDLTFLVAWLFLAVASALPAALFVFFHRQKIPTLRLNFLRDVVRLDPNVQTIQDAESAYDDRIRDVYGSGTDGGTPGGMVPVLVATTVITAMWIWALVPGMEAEARTDSFGEMFLPDRHVVTFAFLGAYYFAINMLFRRYTRSDLGPKAYTHITVRMLVAVVTAWVVSYAPLVGDDGEASSLLLLLAFMIGIVPETGTAIVQDMLQQWKPVGRAIPSLAEEHPLSRLNGVSLYDRTHLLEVGIENVESLAHHHLVELMLWTRIPTPRLVDFVDQAILYLHVRGAVTDGGDDDEARMVLCRHGIRTASDLERAHALALDRSPEEAGRLLRLLDRPGAEVSRLRVVLDAMEDDEWMVYIRQWRDQNAPGEPVASVDEFVHLACRPSPSVRRVAQGPDEHPFSDHAGGGRGDIDLPALEGNGQAAPAAPLAGGAPAA